MTFESKCLIDATGHDIEIVKTFLRKVPGVELMTPTGTLMGESSMNAEKGEKILLDTTKEIWPGLFVTGSMLLSGEKVAQLIIKKLN